MHPGLSRYCEVDVAHLSLSGVTRILGTTKELASDSAEGFSQMIREYIDSSYQSPEQKSSSSKVRIRPPAFWPLIRQVHVLCNAEALSTGAVLVDLPGGFFSLIGVCIRESSSYI